MRRVAVCLLAAAGLATSTAPARAHGPCQCLFPVLVAPAEPGKRPVRLSASVPAYRVIFNPRPRQLGIAPASLASAYRPGAPTVTVLDRARRISRRRWSFRSPDVPPGVYLVLIFDGSEGGAHSTWDYVHMGGPAPAPAVTPAPAPKPASATPRPVAATTAAGAALGAVLALALSALTRRGRGRR